MRIHSSVSRSMRSSVRLVSAAAAAVLTLGAVAVASPSAAPRRAALSPSAASQCAPGYAPLGSEQRAVPTRPLGLTRAAASASSGLCIANRHPESLREFDAAHSLFGPRTADEATLLAQALQQQSAMTAATRSKTAGSTTAAKPAVAGSTGAWKPYGSGPQYGNDSRYEISGEGISTMAGRIDNFAYDARGKRVFAVMGTGGVWMTTNLGKSWTSIGDTLPSQINGAIAWSSAGGGTLVVVGGEPVIAYGSHVGIGSYRTRNLGRTWERIKGLPSGALGFAAETDPTHPSVMYAATSKGLYRSSDGGASFKNVKLPTGGCAGKTDNQRCLLANMVTDVVVQAPDKFSHQGGAVLAVVGYRAGRRPYPQYPTQEESPANGLYRSTTGAVGTFTRLAAPGFTKPERIGRTELGVAQGTEQNHDYVYAIVQDSTIFQGGASDPIDLPPALYPGVSNSTLEGIYVSPDFGGTWTQMANHQQIADNPASGSALAVTGQALLFAPGVQAWYNEWIHPDPTRQDSNGVPTRLTFGLEEVWQNEITTLPQNGRSSFKVIGKYFAGTYCGLIRTGVPVCPTGRENAVQTTTTHPDQQEGIYIPDGNGGVTLMVGNDGGAYSQHADANKEFSQNSWGDGINQGFNTLLPYHARIAKDGVVWYGNQDNGSGKIEHGKYIQTYGGDGTYVAVDPNNSDYAWVATPGAAMVVTTDGGLSWHNGAPTIDNPQFATPFVMDPKDANHLMTAGTQVVETSDGPKTCTIVAAPVAGDAATTTCSWRTVYNLGTMQQPGNDAAKASDTDPANSMSAVDLSGDNAYVAYCGPCDIMNSNVPFANGIATNVGAATLPQRGTSDGWHIAEARGLPNRTIRNVVMDPKNPKTVYVALGGYARGWRGPGTYGDKNKRIGTGSVYRSTDAGRTFTNISAGVPNVPANALALRGSQVIVGTDIGVFISSDAKGSSWAALGAGLPHTAVSSLQMQPGHADVLMASTFGRSIWTYRFPSTAKKVGHSGIAIPVKALPLAGVLLTALAGLMASMLASRRRTALLPA